MDETLVGDMHTLPHFARDRHFPIILSLIKHTSKGQITQSGRRVISWIRWERGEKYERAEAEDYRSLKWSFHIPAPLTAHFPQRASAQFFYWSLDKKKTSYQSGKKPALTVFTFGTTQTTRTFLCPQHIVWRADTNDRGFLKQRSLWHVCNTPTTFGCQRVISLSNREAHHRCWVN